MTPNDDAKVTFVHYVTSPIRRWSEFIKQGHVIWNMRMYPVAHVWTRYSPAQSLPQAWDGSHIRDPVLEHKQKVAQ